MLQEQLKHSQHKRECSIKDCWQRASSHLLDQQRHHNAGNHAQQHLCVNANNMWAAVKIYTHAQPSCKMQLPGEALPAYIKKHGSNIDTKAKTALQVAALTAMRCPTMQCLNLQLEG